MTRFMKLILLLVTAPCNSFQILSPLIKSRVASPFAVSPTALSRDPFAIPAKQNCQKLDEISSLSNQVPDNNQVNMKPHNSNILQQLSKLRPLILSLAVFLLPFLIAMPSWAVQSGGRIGGSMGGSSRSSGGYSRSYGGSNGGYSRGYNRGYSSGYYSRPSVVVSPGITPYYR